MRLFFIKMEGCDILGPYERFLVPLLTRRLLSESRKMENVPSFPWGFNQNNLKGEINHENRSY